jgi:hypothetical protein
MVCQVVKPFLWQYGLAASGGFRKQYRTVALSAIIPRLFGDGLLGSILSQFDRPSGSVPHVHLKKRRISPHPLRTTKESPHVGYVDV